MTFPRQVSAELREIMIEDRFTWYSSLPYICFLGVGNQLGDASPNEA